VLNRVFAVILFLLFVFMAIVDVKVLTEEGSIRWGIFAGYLVGTVLLAYGAVWFWRRGGRRDTA
jgi:protein-S-isoprenylcysteine O-methyltransferase Ste14